MLSNQEKQKSLKRRFLLILGLLVFGSLAILGLVLIFWNGMPLDMPKTTRQLFGGVMIIYALLRFPRLLRKDTNEK
ncbi:hypothetical protein KXQ82_12290 [Mucilaginibacter sp. HMF5004]|uniref:hypothetical protein n=1 Tax=Mucilaginibacter rivuli TaxID=2857527 RepID=UPI001C5D5C36|nr:hypothetical protein [Mucilaginibacter rivuli]MBW4890506.1 hypothetical protein [Mucilaginibacter rivuli]